MGCHPSHWRTHIFQDGYCTTNQLLLLVIFFPALPLFGWFNHQPLINFYRRFPFSKFCFTFCWTNPDESIWGSTFRADFPNEKARTLWAWSASKMGTGFCWKRPLGRQRWVETGVKGDHNLPIWLWWFISTMHYDIKCDCLSQLSLLNLMIFDDYHHFPIKSDIILCCSKACSCSFLNCCLGGPNIHTDPDGCPWHSGLKKI